jgi:hypothetical protein
MRRIVEVTVNWGDSRGEVLPQASSEPTGSRVVTTFLLLEPFIDHTATLPLADCSCCDDDPPFLFSINFIGTSEVYGTEAFAPTVLNHCHVLVTMFILRIQKLLVHVAILGVNGYDSEQPPGFS